MNKLTFLLAFCLFQMTWSQNIEITYKVKFRPQKENDLMRIEYSLLKVNGLNSEYIPAKKMNDSLEVDETYLNFMVLQDAFQIKYYGSFNDLKFFYQEKPIDNWVIIPNSAGFQNNYKTQQAKIQLDGRSWIATFTPDISISKGPYKFQGLPGLITEIHSEDQDYSFEMISLKHSEEEKNLHLENYKKIEKKKLQIYISEFFKDPASKKLSLKNSYGDTFDYQPNGKKDENYRSTNAFIFETHQKYNNPIDKETFILVF
ncbi:GLPGLI family protein [Chryseobacterium sp. CCH4-E10]|uniref:GLPGLI family protein n=1 Tax=Chryseobacterium sp. CCH4-E10 TaxID=1768758 RepID=UPI0009ECBE48|nr:GLPGLI family protein [Chryseobacterium sp. CCH4-E10]